MPEVNLLLLVSAIYLPSRSIDEPMYAEASQLLVSVLNSQEKHLNKQQSVIAYRQQQLFQHIPYERLLLWADDIPQYVFHNGQTTQYRIVKAWVG